MGRKLQGVDFSFWNQIWSALCLIKSCNAVKGHVERQASTCLCTSAATCCLQDFDRGCSGAQFPSSLNGSRKLFILSSHFASGLPWFHYDSFRFESYFPLSEIQWSYFWVAFFHRAIRSATTVSRNLHKCFFEQAIASHRKWFQMLLSNVFREDSFR